VGRKFALWVSVLFFMLAASAGLTTVIFLIAHGIPHLRTWTAFFAFIVFLAYGLAAHRWMGDPSRYMD